MSTSQSSEVVAEKLSRRGDDFSVPSTEHHPEQSQSPSMGNVADHLLAICAHAAAHEPAAALLKPPRFQFQRQAFQLERFGLIKNVSEIEHYVPVIEAFCERSLRQLPQGQFTMPYIPFLIVPIGEDDRMKNIARVYSDGSVHLGLHKGQKISDGFYIALGVHRLFDFGDKDVYYQSVMSSRTMAGKEASSSSSREMNLSMVFYPRSEEEKMTMKHALTGEFPASIQLSCVTERWQLPSVGVK